MPIGTRVGAELTALLVWLFAPAVLVGLLVVLYPPYLRWRTGKRRDPGVVIRMPGSSVPTAPLETGVRSRTPHAPGS